VNSVKVLIKKHHQILIFGFVAVASALFELGLYTALFELIKISPLTSSPIAQIASMVFNFSLNKFFTFKTGKTFKIQEAGGYFVVWLLNLFVTTIIMAYLIQNTSIYPTLIRVIVIFIMFFFNYFAMKRLVFKKD
jgi:putative flippase GtrA